MITKIFLILLLSQMLLACIAIAIWIHNQLSERPEEITENGVPKFKHAPPPPDRPPNMVYVDIANTAAIDLFEALETSELCQSRKNRIINVIKAHMEECHFKVILNNDWEKEKTYN